MAAIRVAVVGGGSGFVLSLLNGVALEAAAGRPYPVRIALYDIRQEAMERWVQYGETLARKLGLPLTIESFAERIAALRDADVVLLSVGFHQADREARECRERYGFPHHSIHDGPPAFWFTRRVWPFCRRLAEEVARVAPRALLLVLPNPTDVLAGALERATGVVCAGLCVETEHLRQHLAFYLGVPEEAIRWEHAGVNHDGWILRWWVGEEDGDVQFRDAILKLPEHPDFHPGNWGMVEVYRATGHLRSSAYHNWPLSISPYPGPQQRESFHFPAQERQQEVALALAEGRLLDCPAAVPPERWPVRYPATGRAIVRFAAAWAGAAPYSGALQVINRGAVANFPPDVRVEVPTLVRERSLHPLAMGELPEWLGGVTRLLALQRRRHADYLLDGRRETLTEALFNYPAVADVDSLRRYGEEVHLLEPIAGE